MKKRLLIKFSLIFTTVLGYFSLTSNIHAEVADQNKTANKESTKSIIEFRCKEHDGIPITVAYTEDRRIELIRWERNIFKNYPPQKRCEEVSPRFQKHYDLDNLDYIYYGEKNGSKIICASEESGKCKPDGILLTLESEDDPKQVMKDIFDFDTREQEGG